MKIKQFDLNFILLLFFISVLFLQFPLNGDLPGNTSSWLAIAFSNFYWEKVIEFFNGSNLTSFLFPDMNVLSYGQGGLLLSLIFIFFKVITQSDIWAYYFFIVLIFSSNAWALYWVFKKLSFQNVAAFIGSFFFTVNPFIFGNMDDPHEVFFPIAFLSLYYFYFFLKEEKNKYLITSLILAAIQIYFSVYIFLFLICGLIIMWLFNPQKRNIPYKVLFLFISILVPFFYIYLKTYFTEIYINPFNTTAVIKDCSLGLMDFFSSMKGNLIYPEKIQDNNFPIFWAFIRRHAFLGIAFLTISITGLFRFSRKFKTNGLFFALVFFLVLSVGPYFKTPWIDIPMPLLIFYKLHDFFLFFRIPLRAFFFVILILSYLSAFQLNDWFSKKEKNKVLYLLFCILIIHSLETIPFPLPSFNASRYVSPSPAMIKFFKNKRGVVLLNLPSSIGTSFTKSENDIYSYNRQVIYMNWKTKHHQNMIGGIHAYWPKFRFPQQQLFDHIPDPTALKQLSEQGVTYISYHQNLEFKWERGKLQELKNSKNLDIIIDEENFTLFKIRPYIPN